MDFCIMIKTGLNIIKALHDRQYLLFYFYFFLNFPTMHPNLYCASNVQARSADYQNRLYAIRNRNQPGPGNRFHPQIHKFYSRLGMLK